MRHQGFAQVQDHLRANHYRWLVTGAAGFIGSHLTRFLLSHDQEVCGLDNFSTGSAENLEWIRRSLSETQANSFLFRQGDIREKECVTEVCSGVDFILHQAALGSVPRSIEHPRETYDVNVTGTVTVFEVAKELGVRKIVYASSSSVYGDSAALPKQEGELGAPLSPYAASKLATEQIGKVFSRVYGLQITALRYFNVFGPRQSEQGPYAAVIPRWIGCLSRSEPCVVFGDGSSSRDFCYIDNIIQANVLAALNGGEKPQFRACNVGCGRAITLQQLYEALKDFFPESASLEHQPFREGDVAHSLADIQMIQKEFGYSPAVSIEEGLKKTVEAKRNESVTPQTF